MKRSLSSRGPAVSSSFSASSVAALRRPSLHAVGDVVASRGLVSPPPTVPSSAADAAWSTVSRDWTCGVVALPRCLERLLSIDSVAVRSAMDRSLVKVHLANGCFNVFKCSESTTVKVMHSLPVIPVAFHVLQCFNAVDWTAGRAYGLAPGALT